MKHPALTRKRNIMDYDTNTTEIKVEGTCWYSAYEEQLKNSEGSEDENE